jgi:DNA-binding response OmpR family regulator
MLVLIVEDDDTIAAPLAKGLAREGFEVERLTGGQATLARLNDRERPPDVVLLDLGLPDLDGFEVCRRLRDSSDVPIIVVTARGEEVDRVIGLELGADDYIVKPFSPEEMGARIRAVLRRAIGNQGIERVIKVQNVEIDLDRRIMTRGGEAVSLTRTEWLLLQYLAANAGKVMLNAELLSKVWGPEYHDDVQYLRVWVSRLRRKLEPNPSTPVIIKTMQGIGYMLDAEPAQSKSSTTAG